MTNKQEGKIIETENTYKCSGGAICGGVIKKSLFYSDPWLYMMSYYMEDEYFELYKNAKESGDKKLSKELFDKYAISAI